MQEAAPPTPIFRLDGAQKALTSDGAPVPIPPKTLDLLLFFAENAGRIVTRDELVEHVWGGLTVSSDAVRYALKALRRGLGDPAGEPRFIETVARRGWRFVGRAVAVSQGSWILEGRAEVGARGASESADPEPFVGREVEMGTLLERLSRAQAGERGALFIRGEPGIGKSRLLEAFLETAQLRRDTLAARANCIEHVGPGMPYAPLFEILERLCERVGGEAPIAMLRRHAPTWLAQMPSLTEPDDRASLEDQIQGATQVRMIREWAHAIERFAEDRTLVIALEDLQWADPSTLATLFFAVRRAESARILLCATLRPEDASHSELDLQRTIDDLAGRGFCERMSPAAFETDSVRAYLEARFGPEQPLPRSKEFCEQLMSASSGNPLFLVSLVDACVEEGLLRHRAGVWNLTGPFRLGSVPASLTPVIERQLDALEDDLREHLDAASVIGMDFSASELAAALEKDVEEVEAGCDLLVADGRFVVARGAVAWPDGTVSSRYRFMHGLHRDALRGLLSPGRRSRLSRAVAERLRAAYAGREEQIAAELAIHFEHGMDPASAAQFRALAGEASAKRFSNLEAVEHFRHALELMGRTDVEGDFLEIRTRLALCAPLAAVSGYGSPELEHNLTRLETLTAGLEDTPSMFPAILGLWSLHFVRADFVRTAAFGDRMLALAERAGPVVRLQAHQSVGHSLFYRGEVVEAQRHYDLATEGYALSEHERQDYSVGDDPLVLVLTCRALSLWFLGRTDEACESAEEAVRQGTRLAHPPSLALAWTYGAVLHQLRGDVERAATWSDRSLEITTAEGIPFWMELSRIVRGWSLANQSAASRDEGIALLRAAIESWDATGSKLGLPHFLCLLAASLGQGDEIDEGLAVLDTAREVMESTGQGVFRSEIDRLRGDLLRRRADANRDASALATARECYLRAAEEAEGQGLRANVLQARLALAELGDEETGSRLAELVATYPADARMDLDLARARARVAS